MKPGAMLVNTGRGALVDTAAVLDALKSGHIGSVALDVYEEEGDLFFEDRSDEILDDDNFARLLTYPNVLITAHQAFLTHEALAAIAETTLSNVATVLAGEHVRQRRHRRLSAGPDVSAASCSVSPARTTNRTVSRTPP